MTAALSPGLSWLIVGGWLLAVVLIVAFFMGATRSGVRREECIARYWVSAPRPSAGSFTEPADPQLRIFGGPYDHEAHEDFE